MINDKMLDFSLNELNKINQLLNQTNLFYFYEQILKISEVNMLIC